MGRDLGGRFKREGTYVYLRLIHVDVLQKSTQYYKAIILQLKINFKSDILLINRSWDIYLLRLLKVWHIKGESALFSRTVIFEIKKKNRYEEQKTVPPLSNKVLGQEESFKYIGELMIEIK